MMPAANTSPLPDQTSHPAHPQSHTHRQEQRPIVTTLMTSIRTSRSPSVTPTLPCPSRLVSSPSPPMCRASASATFVPSPLLSRPAPGSQLLEYCPFHPSGYAKCRAGWGDGGGAARFPAGQLGKQMSRPSASSASRRAGRLAWRFFFCWFSWGRCDVMRCIRTGKALFAFFGWPFAACACYIPTRAVNPTIPGWDDGSQSVACSALGHWAHGDGGC